MRKFDLFLGIGLKGIVQQGKITLLKKFYNMKKLILLLLCFFISFNLLAQTPLPPAPPVPCKVSECPLPTNFDWIVACCSNSDAKKEQLKKYMQNMIHGEQQINYRSWQLLRDGVVTPETYQKVLNYLAWHQQMTTTRQVKDWPMDELRQRNIEAEKLVEHDVKKNQWIAPIKAMGWLKYVWFVSLLLSFIFIVSWLCDMYFKFQNKKIRKLASKVKEA